MRNVLSVALGIAASTALAGPKPLMRDFIGLNTHTVQFRPDLYWPVTRVLRNYHPMHWDTGDNPATPPKFPMTTNGVNWADLYGKWRPRGYKIDASIQFESVPHENWKDVTGAAFAYGKAFASYFGPSGKQPWVEAAEIGNEPVKWNDAEYRTMFDAMARGLRSGDPRLQISTCAVVDGNWDQYSRDINALKGMDTLFDIINVHTYAFAEYWPTWRRSYPEDPKTKYLTAVQDMIRWRDRNTPGKRLWVTEFGWDSSTKKPDPKGDMKDWVGVDDVQQARYIVRSYLVFSRMDVDRAYLYWFNDEDQPSLHAASGLTRNYVPKPSYHAVAHLLASLGDTRFKRAIQESPDGYAYEYVGGKGRVLVAWRPQGAGTMRLPIGQVKRTERMPLAAGAAEKVVVRRDGKNLVVPVDESPVYIWLR